MSRSEPLEYERVIVEGVLETRAELHLGAGRDGEIRIQPPAKPDRPAREPRLVQYAELCLDLDDRPFIPASSLRGLLAARLHTRLDEEGHEHLFGVGRRAHNEDAGTDQDYGRPGALRVYDAQMMVATGDPLVRAHVAIDPVTGSAADKQLFAQRVVPAGTRFQCRLELDRVEERHLLALLSALRGLDGGLDSALGQGKGSGRGTIAWTDDSVRVLHAGDLTHWLMMDDQTPLEARFRDWTPPEITAHAADANWLRLDLRLLPRAPLLTIDPVQGHRGARDPTREFHYTRRGNQACIPGSSLKGLLRGHCRRILLTMARYQGGRAGAAAIDELLTPLFGSAEQGMGALRFQDALGDLDPQRDIHPQTFNAVDRFTGGVSEGALYDVEAAWPAELHTALGLHRDLIAPKLWALGLLVLALRDALEGDLAVGWGKARGFGALGIELHVPGTGDLGTWADLCAALGTGGLPERAEVESWVAALEHEVSSIEDQLAKAATV